jgi:hypothetical protein
MVLKCIGVLSRDEMDICNPPILDMVAHAIHFIGLGFAGNNSSMQVRMCKTLTCNAFASRRWVKSLDHIHLCVLGCAFHIPWS